MTVCVCVCVVGEWVGGACIVVRVWDEVMGYMLVVRVCGERECGDVPCSVG